MELNFSWKDFYDCPFLFSKGYIAKLIIKAKYDYAKSVGKPTQELINFIVKNVDSLYFEEEYVGGTSINSLIWEKGNLPFNISINKLMHVQDYGVSSMTFVKGIDWATPQERVRLEKTLHIAYNETSRIRHEKEILQEKINAEKERNRVTAWLEDLGYGKETN